MLVLIAICVRVTVQETNRRELQRQTQQNKIESIQQRADTLETQNEQIKQQIEKLDKEVQDLR